MSFETDAQRVYEESLRLVQITSTTGGYTDAYANARKTWPDKISEFDTSIADLYAARDDAQVAAAMASSGVTVYTDTIAQGLAAVADGQNFGVRAGQADGLTAPTVFRRDTASTYTEIYKVLDRDAIDVGRVNEVSDFVSIPKARLFGTIFAVKQDPTSTAIINTVYTRDDDGVTVNTGYDTTLHNVTGYAYSVAKIFNDYATEAATKKYAFFVKADREAECFIRIMNNTSWGGTGNGMLLNAPIQLNAVNNYQAIVEFDYSSQEAADFYATPGRYQFGYYAIAVESYQSVTEETLFSTYCYEVTDTAGTQGDMTSGYLSDVAAIQSDVAAIQSDVAAIQSDVAAIQNELSITQYIACWGDSLTAGGGWTTTLQSLSGMAVHNAGIGGEKVPTISARQGGDVMLVNDITIPATIDPVLVADRAVEGGITTALGELATPLLQGGVQHVNPCNIAGVDGNLAWTGTSSSDQNGTWTFTRSTAGSATAINRPTAIRTYADMNWNGGIQIIFMGQNGGYVDDADLIWKHQLMIEHSTAKHTIVLGLSSGSAASRANYEAAMRQAFGRYFISLREYLSYPIYTGVDITSCYGLDDAGITPTPEDLTAISTGTVPPSLLADSVHYTEACKTVIGNMLYKKMVELNLFD